MAGCHIEIPEVCGVDCAEEAPFRVSNSHDSSRKFLSGRTTVGRRGCVFSSAGGGHRATATIPANKELYQRQIEATDRQIDALVYEVYRMKKGAENDQRESQKTPPILH